MDMFSLIYALGVALGLASPSPRIADLLDRWCASRTADGHQPRGVARYRQHLDAFVRWAGDDSTLDDLSRQRIIEYKTALGSRPTGRRRRSDPYGYSGVPWDYQERPERSQSVC